MLWDVLAPVVRWPLRSPLRLGAVLAVLVVAVLLYSAQSDPDQSGTDDAAATSAPADSAEATKTLLGTDALGQPVPTEGPGPLADPGAGESEPMQAPDIATERAWVFMQAWASPDLPAKKWRSGLAPFVDPLLAEGFAQTDPKNVPATKVKDLDPVQVNERAIVYRVSTDAGDVRLVMTSDGITWWASELEPDRDLTTTAPGTGASG